jgi:hypothetical protein
MIKGKRRKESQKEPPQESLNAQQSSEVSVSVQTLPPRKKKDKTPVAHTPLPSQPAHPHPIKNAPSSGGTQFTILQRSSPKEETKKDRKDKEREEPSSQSSQEAGLDSSLADKKGKKKKGQATLAASHPKINYEDEKEDTSGSEDELPALGSSEEQSPTTSTDFLAEFLGEKKEENLSPVPDSVSDDFPGFLKKTGEIKALLYQWQSAKEFPEFNNIDVSEEEMDQYIERVLKDSHKWKDTEGVNKTLQEINLEDKIVRHNDRYLRMI